MKITVTYKGMLKPGLDKKIKEALESIGAKWTGQGTNVSKMVRDISFEIEVEK